MRFLPQLLGVGGDEVQPFAFLALVFDENLMQSVSLSFFLGWANM